MKLLAIVPCFNEAGTVVEVVKGIRKAMPETDILVVDDGSTDNSGPLAAGAGATVVRLPYNMGIGAAVQTGYIYAFNNGYDAAVQIDGDNQHDPAETGFLIERIVSGEADMVVGSRFLKGEGFQSTLPRRVGINMFSRMLSVMTREPLSDPTSGFRAVNRRGITLFAKEYPEDYPEVESLFLAHIAGLRLAEVPVLMRPRSGGSTSITPARSAYYMVKVMLGLLIWIVRGKPVLEE